MPTQVEIAIASLQRLIREEKSYHTELTQQRKQLTAMESGSMIDDEENKNFQLKQQRQAIDETMKIFPSLRERIIEATNKVEGFLEEGKANGDPQSIETINKAKEAVASAKCGLREIS